MDCVEVRELVQRWLDGELAVPQEDDWAAHLANCRDCRDLYAAAQRLVEGIHLLVPPSPPSDLSERIYQQIMSERVRAARSRRQLVSLAVAAGLLLACYAAYRPLRSLETGNSPPASTRLQRPGPVPSPSLQHRIEEASLAVVALTRQAADETMGQTKFLLPARIPPAALGDFPHPDDAMESPVRSLRDVQEGMSAGLEPVANSARRAIGFFWRRIPPMESSMQ
jgi:Putative zinc-finger